MSLSTDRAKEDTEEAAREERTMENDTCVSAVNQDGESSERQQQSTKEDGEPLSDTHQKRCFQRLMCRRTTRRLRRVAFTWPRSFFFVFGVILPLFILIAVSLFFGYILAQLEASDEIDANNAVITNRALIQLSSVFHDNVTVSLPSICLEIFKDESKPLNLTLLEEFDRLFNMIVEGQTPSSNETSTEDITFPQNTSKLMSFMQTCGTRGLDIANEFLNVVPLYVNDEIISSEITFNWIRCDGVPGSLSLTDQLWGRPFVNKTRLRPSIQQSVAISEWRRQQQTSYNALAANLTMVNETVAVEARIEAFQQSLQDADGFVNCYADSLSGAWFWFTVMTTIGYGNQVPVTRGGQAMVYTIGFLCILLFGIILGVAGTIVSTIWDDFVNRTALASLNFTWAACMFWGCCYYAWMLVIATYTQTWKAERVDEEMEFSEAYWFSFISTTTVGLGDYILEQEVILHKDLITFPLLFLTGFVFFSNFIVKLTDLLSKLLPSGRKSLEQVLDESNVPCCGKTRTRRSKKSKADVEPKQDNGNTLNEHTAETVEPHAEAENGNV